MENTSKGMPVGIKILIGVIVLTGLSVGGYFVYDYVKKPKAPVEPDANKTPPVKEPKKPAEEGLPYSPESDGGSGGSGSGGGSKSSGFPLKKGSKGSNVTALQNAINKYYTGYPAKQIAADSDYGSKTQTAVEGLYGKNKIEVYQGDIDWLNSNSYKERQTKKPAPKPATKPKASGGGIRW